MTTNIKVHVNGRYRLVIKQDGVEKMHEVHGNYEGSPNPSGEGGPFNLVHGSIGNKFVFSEFYVPTEEEILAEQVDKDKRTKSAKLEVNAGKAIGTDAEGKDTKTGKPVDVDAHLAGQKTDDLKVDMSDDK